MLFHFVDLGKAEVEVSCSNHSRVEGVLKKNKNVGQAGA